MPDDLNSAFRSLRSSPTYTVVSLIVLALGIGSATALYSVADAVVLRGLPFDEHDRLMVVHEYETTRRSPFTGSSITPQSYLDWRAQQHSFTGLAATASTSMRLHTETGEPTDARALRVTHEFFSVFRISPQVGRLLTADDEVPGQHRQLVLSDAYWRQRFGGAPDAIGSTIDLNEEPWQIVGVMPRGFSYPVGGERATSFYIPASFSEPDRIRGNSRNFTWTIIGRLAPGVAREQAQDEMHRISEAADLQHPQWGPGRRARVITLHDHVVGRARAWMLMLLAAVGLLLLIACANVANLMLARASARGRDVGIRAALGASRWRIARALLVEGVVLALAGGALGMVLAFGGVQLLTAWLPADLPRVSDVAINLRVLAASLAAATVTGVLFGVAPALHASRGDVVTVLKEGGRTSTAHRVGHRLRSLLVVAEVAIAVVLLVGAALFSASFIQLVRIDPGFDTRNLLTLGISPSPLRPQAPGQVQTPADRDEASRRARAYVESVIEAISTLPAVRAVSAVQGSVPLTGSFSRTRVAFPGQPPLDEEDGGIDLQAVRADYFHVLGIPLQRGRWLQETDSEQSEPVAIINEAAARKYFPDRDPLGARLVISTRERTIVGVVADMRQLGLEQPARHAIFLPHTQQSIFSMTLLIRTAGDPIAMLPAVKAAIWRVNPEQRFPQEIATMDSHLERLLAQRRFNMALLVLFGILGLVLTAAGIYGVLAYGVEQRTSEIGLRMALGATPRHVLVMVLSKAALLMLAGAALGAVAAWQLRAVVRAFVFEVAPDDPRIFLVALVVLAGAGLAASAIPARRAARVDPVVVLGQ